MLATRQVIFAAARSHTPNWRHYQHHASDFGAYILGYLSLDSHATAPDLMPLDLMPDPSNDDIAERLCDILHATDATQLSFATELETL